MVHSGLKIYIIAVHVNDYRGGSGDIEREIHWDLRTHRVRSILVES